jgi:hypothetical protein
MASKHILSELIQSKSGADSKPSKERRDSDPEQGHPGKVIALQVWRSTLTSLLYVGPMAMSSTDSAYDLERCMIALTSEFTLNDDYTNRTILQSVVSTAQIIRTGQQGHLLPFSNFSYNQGGQAD